MAKMNGTLLLSMKQAKMIVKGQTIEVQREGKPLFVGLKSKHSEKVKLLSEIKMLRQKIARIEEKEKQKETPLI